MIIELYLFIIPLELNKIPQKMSKQTVSSNIAKLAEILSFRKWYKIVINHTFFSQSLLSI